jgi:XTP/dITP diphosphohydrolase
MAQSARGEGGFGFDAILIPTGETRTMAEMSSEEKNKISHRGRALAKLKQFLVDHA